MKVLTVFGTRPEAIKMAPLVHAAANDPLIDPDKKMLLVTGHRRESLGRGFEENCHALADIATTHQDIQIVYPVHLNPNVREPVNRILGHA